MKPPQWVIDRAVEWASKSPCRSKRGAVIWATKNPVDSPIAAAYNDQPYPYRCDGSEGCKSVCSKTAVHAEQGALIVLPILPSYYSELQMLHVKVVDGELVPSGPPSCLECSKLILGRGITYMWLYHQEGWQRYTAEEFHQKTLEYHSLQSIAPANK